MVHKIPQVSYRPPEDSDKRKPWKFTKVWDLQVDGESYATQIKGYPTLGIQIPSKKLGTGVFLEAWIPSKVVGSLGLRLNGPILGEVDLWTETVWFFFREKLESVLWHSEEKANA